jgi:undecaprenyl-diphosphatase
MTIFESIIFGLVEGLTEFLPISSTGHLILTGHLFGLSQDEYLKSFEIIIQLGAILSVILLYWKSLLDFENIKKIIFAFIPTGVIGLVAYKFVKTYLLENTGVVVWSLLLGGVLLIIVEYLNKENKSEVEEGFRSISYRQSFFIGLFQSIAIIPGVSRSASTILGGIALGLKRKTATEFSFVLAVPTMLSATILDLYKNYSSFSSNEISTLTIGFLVSFLVALMSIKFLLSYIRNNNFVAFGVYRIILALAFLLFII